MDHLRLVQEFVRLADIAQEADTPPSVVSQTGQILEAINYIARAHAAIQVKWLDWKFLWGDIDTITTVDDTATYAGATGIGIWDKQRFFYDNEELDVMEWEDYVPDTTLAKGTPEFAVIRPDNQILLVPTPADVYTISYEYFLAPKELDLGDDEDLPLIPEQFHWAIIGKALMEYGTFESAEETRLHGAEIYLEFMTALEKHQLPRRQQMQGRRSGEQIVVTTE